MREQVNIQQRIETARELDRSVPASTGRLICIGGIDDVLIG